MKATVNPYGIIGFALALVPAVSQEWSLPEFCWSTWLAGLVYAWTCAAAASLQIIVTAPFQKSAYEERLPALARLHPALFSVGVATLGACVGLLSFRIYGFLFGFYGLFLSVFAEMEPLNLFGRNGFINSDFFGPVVHLIERFWPMAVGLLIANWQDFIGRNPWQRILLPMQRQVLRLHLFVLALPFLSLIAWMLFGKAYQPVTIVLLLALLYLVPKAGHRD